jgi:hypothetical protein
MPSQRLAVWCIKYGDNLKYKGNFHTVVVTYLTFDTHQSFTARSVVMIVPLITCTKEQFIHSSMALQPFVGNTPVLQFRNLYYTVGRTPWRGDQPVASSLPTHGTKKTQNNAHRNVHDWSGIRIHDPRVQASEDNSCLRPRGHCDRPPKKSNMP